MTGPGWCVLLVVLPGSGRTGWPWDANCLKDDRLSCGETAWGEPGDDQTRLLCVPFILKRDL